MPSRRVIRDPASCSLPRRLAHSQTVCRFHSSACATTETLVNARLPFSLEAADAQVLDPAVGFLLTAASAGAQSKPSGVITPPQPTATLVEPLVVEAPNSTGPAILGSNTTAPTNQSSSGVHGKGPTGVRGEGLPGYGGSFTSGLSMAVFANGYAGGLFATCIAGGCVAVTGQGRGGGVSGTGQIGISGIGRRDSGSPNLFLSGLAPLPEVSG